MEGGMKGNRECEEECVCGKMCIRYLEGEGERESVCIFQLESFREKNILGV